MCLQVPGDASFALLPQEGFDDPQNERYVARVAVGLGRMRLFGFVLRLGEYLQTLSFLLAFFADFLTVAGACEPTGRAFSCRLHTALAFSPNPKATNYAAGNHSGPQKKRRLDPLLGADLFATSSAAASQGTSFKALPDDWVIPPKTWCDTIDVD
eukprot:s69_g2.t1